MDRPTAKVRIQTMQGSGCCDPEVVGAIPTPGSGSVAYGFANPSWVSLVR